MTDPAALTSPETEFAGQSFALAGPSTRSDPAHTPVRGDLAHIRLAGKVFVPHYAVPMPHAATQATAVFEKASAEANPVGAVPEGGVFQVLDMAGDWAWGVIASDDEDGPVGYVPMAVLKPCE